MPGLKPKHREPLEAAERPWVFLLQFSVRAPPQYVEAWFALADINVRTQSVLVKPGKAQDGPLAKQLASFLESKGVRAGGLRGGGMEEEEYEEGEDGVRRLKRRR